MRRENTQEAFQDTYNLSLNQTNDKTQNHPFAGNLAPQHLAPQKAIATCVEAISNRLPMNRFSANSRVPLFEAYAECVDVLSKMQTDAAALNDKIIRCNTEHISPAKSGPLRVSDIRRCQGIDQYQPIALVPFSDSPVRSEVAAQPVETIARQMKQSVFELSVRLLMSVDAQLAHLRHAKQVGSIEWMSETVCRFSFHTNTIIDRRTTMMKRENSGVYERIHTQVHDFKRTVRHTETVHDVVDAAVYLLPARDVDVPRRVRRLIEAIPSWLRGISAVVTGYEIAEERKSQQSVVDNWTAAGSSFVEQLPVRKRERPRTDPALVIGTHVLTGWN